MAVLSNWSRRDFLRLLELSAAAGLWSDGAVARSGALLTEIDQLPTPPNSPNMDNPVLADAQQKMTDYINAGIQALKDAAGSNSRYILEHSNNGYSGPEISTNYAPPRPYMPQAEHETDFEGLVYPEDYPPDYMKFDPETGLFDDVII